MNKPWDTDWGDLLEAAHAGGKLSAEQASRYLSQSVAGAVKFQPRARLRITDPLPFVISSSAPLRVGNRTAMWLAFDSKRLWWPGQAAPAPVNWPRAGYIYMRAGGFMTEGSAVVPRDFPANLKPGVQQVYFVTEFGIHSRRTIESRLAPAWLGKLDLPGTVDVEPADHPTVKSIHDPAMADRVRQSLTLVLREGTGGCNLEVQVRNPPVGLAFSVSVKGASGVDEFASSKFACPAGTNCNYTPDGFSLAPHKTVDVILRSDPSAATATVDTFEYWDGELVFKDVPVN